MTQKKNFITCDGNYAAAYLAYMFSELACIYPITPSSNMAEYVDEWAAEGKKNIFGETVTVSEMQSEAGAAGAMHGALQSGSLCSTYTASQGLLLMIPNMYKMSGELLPGVFHVSARSIAAQALSIFGDHSDVMSTRMTGFAMLATGSVQEIMDLAGIAHLAAIKTRVPFLHFFDGFRTSHEIQKVEAPTTEEMAELLDYKALQEFRDRALNPEHPVTRGTAQNPDIYFQSREAANTFYEPVADVVADYMKIISQRTGREYHPFVYNGAPDAESIIIAMGSVTETINEVVENVCQQGAKLGCVTVHLYRPFSAKYLLSVIPKTVKRIAVLDRTKEIGANGDPLYLDVKDVYYGVENAPLIIGGRYGLSSKDTTPAQIVSVFNNLAMKEPKNQFTVGIVDDVTFKSLPLLPEISVTPKGTFEAKFFGLGADGTVGANKNSIKIIGDTTDKYCQAYFAYDSKKSGGLTVSHLRFGDRRIRAPYLVNMADFIACHVPSYLDKYDLLKGLKQGGIFLFNSIWDVEETKKRLPDHMKKYMADNDIQFYIINATMIAEEIGMGNRTNTIMQTAFFKLADVIPFELAVSEMKKAIEKTYGRKGEDVVEMNIASIVRGSELTHIPIPTEWKGLKPVAASKDKSVPEFITNVVEVMNAQQGDNLPVSTFVGREDGTFPSGTTIYEKRGIAINVPVWIPENCIQCNQCAYVCPHAAIRPFLMDEEELKNAPEGTATLKANGKGLENYKFRIQVSVLDCTGCGNCVDTCPAKTKALGWELLDTQMHEAKRWEYFEKNVTYKDHLVDKFANVKNSQFAQPLFEFSGACMGCGETPYIKAITQLYGDRMIVANATGCSSIYGGSAPSTPYSFNNKGKGVAWANSLFEDNAEYGYGIGMGVRKMRERIQRLMEQGLQADLSPEVKTAFQEWIDNKENANASELASEKVRKLIASVKHPVIQQIQELDQYLIKKSVWVIGGDGWAYDIGYGGLDHVIASGEDINLLVLDTEVYSNTGGQASKSTPIAAVAKFAAAGKRIRKKDLGMMAMSYGYVYVAQVAMGASQTQYFKAIREAEAYPGPSLIIAYSPCINHGPIGGMGKTQEISKKAVECGYWTNYRYNPLLEQEGKNPFLLDSKEPDFGKFQDFLNSEVRFTSLMKTFPEIAKELFQSAEENARWRHRSYQRLAQMEFHPEKL
jgi:pyruvate-ferredoxin/flavodoxin oxidoreductase